MRTLEEIKAVLKEHREEVRQKYKARIKGIFGSYVNVDLKHLD
jgi:hypothetical protein